MSHEHNQNLGIVRMLSYQPPDRLSINMAPPTRCEVACTRTNLYCAHVCHYTARCRNRFGPSNPSFTNGVIEGNRSVCVGLVRKLCDTFNMW